MPLFDTFCERIGPLLEVAKDIPMEKIAAVGLLLLGMAAMARDVALGRPGAGPGQD